LKRLERKLNFPSTSPSSNYPPEVVPTDAERVTGTMRDFRRLAELLSEQKALSTEEMSEIVDIMYRGALHDYDAFTLPAAVSKKFKSLLQNLFSAKCGKKSRPNETEMKIRYPSSLPGLIP